MATQETYESIINWYRTLLSIFGLWPGDNVNQYGMYSRIRFFIASFLIFYCGTIPQTMDLLMVCRDIDSFMENLTNSNIVMTNSLVKLIVWWCNKTDLAPLYQCIQADWMKSKSDLEYQEMISVAKLSKSIIKFFILIIQGNLLISCSLNLFINLPARLLLFSKSYYPYNISTTPMYEITCLTQFFAGITAAMTSIAIDGFIGFLVLHICGQMAILKGELKCLTDDYVMNQEDTLDLVKKKLRFIIRRHAHLISFVEIIEKDFNIMFLFQILSLSIQICFHSYQSSKLLSTGKKMSILQFFFTCYFNFCALLIFYIHCYIDEQLIVQTSEIRVAAYECGWHKLPVDQAKALTFIIQRTEKSPCITAGKFCSFSMLTFAEVIKRSVGFLFFLWTIKEF